MPWPRSSSVSRPTNPHASYAPPLSAGSGAVSYREFHRTPPLLGILGGFSHSSQCSRFVPITTMTLIPFIGPVFPCRALDCRHGRVLFDGSYYGRSTRESSLAVWDPITGDHKLLRDPHPLSYHGSGAVVCAAAGCNHRGCHGGGPFIVVFVSTPTYNNARAWVYSSEAAVWSAPASVQLRRGDCFIVKRRAAIVGDQIYFLIGRGTEILNYDMGKQFLTMIGSPCSIYEHGFMPALMTMEDGSSLGFIAAKDSSLLHLWARKVNPDGSMGWVQDSVILLNNLPPIVPRTGHTCRQQVDVIGFAEGVDIVLLCIDGATFIFDLKSERFMKLNDHVGNYYDGFPYMAFYIPDFASSTLPQLPMETE